MFVEQTEGIFVPLSDRSALSHSLSLPAFLLSLVLSFWVYRAPLQAAYDAITTVLRSAALSESGKPPIPFSLNSQSLTITNTVIVCGP